MGLHHIIFDWRRWGSYRHSLAVVEVMTVALPRGELERERERGNGEC